MVNLTILKSMVYILSMKDEAHGMERMSPQV
jgi:hypothetical protein